IWSEMSVGRSGEFVHDEAARARRRGIYLTVAIDEVEPPLGFGQEQALKLIGWRGARRDPHFQDVLAAARAMIAGGPRATPTARVRTIPRRGLTSRRAILAGGVAATAVAIGAVISIPGAS